MLDKKEYEWYSIQAYWHRGLVKWYDRGLQNLWWEFDSLIPCWAIFRNTVFMRFSGIFLLPKNGMFHTICFIAYSSAQESTNKSWTIPRIQKKKDVDGRDKQNDQSNKQQQPYDQRRKKQESINKVSYIVSQKPLLFNTENPPIFQSAMFWLYRILILSYYLLLYPICLLSHSHHCNSILSHPAVPHQFHMDVPLST